MIEDCEFGEALLHALKHLYDPNALQANPLIRLFGLMDAPMPTSALRRTITDTIRSLKPTSDVPDHTPLWSTYEILLQRYVQQCSQLEVALQLGVSTRHLRRQEADAVEVLTRHLAQRFPSAPEGAEASTRNVHVEANSAASDGFEWLGASESWAVDVKQVLASVFQLIQPLAAEHDVQLILAAADDLPPLAVHPVGLRQILMSLLGVSIRRAAGGAIQVSVQPTDAGVAAAISEESRQPNLQHEGEHAQSLAMVKRLAQACGATMAMTSEDDGRTVMVMFPALRQIPVLVIDDNRDAIELYQRYVSGTRYRIQGASNLESALALAAQVLPQAVILDIMMPDIDGWEVLGRLRHHPSTQNAAIIVCTILPEEALALSLGASGFLTKPLTRAAFLGALDRSVPGEPAPR